MSVWLWPLGVQNLSFLVRNAQTVLDPSSITFLAIFLSETLKESLAIYSSKVGDHVQKVHQLNKKAALLGDLHYKKVFLTHIWTCFGIC